jgi:putative lipoic acid-binding regulatory protein
MGGDAPSEATGLQFPCEFPIKAMGLAEPNLDALVVEIVLRHVGSLAEGAVRSRISRQGKYQSVTITINADSQVQLDAIYQELTAHPRITLAL